MPDRVSLAAAGLRRHERFWCPAFTFGDLLHRPARRHGSVGVQDIVGVAFLGELVAMLDQEPVGPFSPGAVVAHTDQHPAAVQLVTVQREFQIAFLVSPLRIVGFPIAAVPELHGTAAILPLRSGAFEIAVIERRILRFDREPLVMRIERGALRHCPGFEDAI